MDDAANAPESLRPPANRADLLRETFARRVSNLMSAARRAGARRDSEAIHDLRVGARWLDAMLRTWEELFPSESRIVALRALRRVRRRLGKARQLEVQIALLEERASRHGEAAPQLLACLRGRLLRRTKRITKRLSPKRLKKLLRRIEEAASDLEPTLNRDPGVFDLAQERVAKMGAVAQVALDLTGQQQDDWTLHQARLVIKKWRYRIEWGDKNVAGGGSELG